MERTSLLQPLRPLAEPHAVGVIGLGQMGRPMSANLVRRGFATSGYDVNETALAAAAATGACAATGGAA